MRRDEFWATRDKVADIYNQQRETLSPALTRFIENCLNAPETDYSHSQFLKVLYESNLGNFNMLSRAAISSNGSISEREKQREINRKKKLTPQQIEIIKRKKKKKMDCVVVKLPLFPGNITKLKFEFVRESKAFYEPDYTLNNANFDAGKVETFVRVWCDPNKLPTVKSHMVAEAKTLQTNMDKEREARKRLKQARRVARLSWMDRKEEPFEDIVLTGHTKDRLTDDFSLKALKSTKDRYAKPQTSVLDGGHCLQCYKPFSSLKDKTPCTFHAGYQVRKSSEECVWSCCSTDVNKSMSSYVAHSHTGCTTSVVHNWRTHAKAKGKTKLKE